MTKSLQENSGITEEVLDLRSLREARGLTLNDISQATKISMKNLEAMENGDFHCLPPPVYTRAYLKFYAKLLGVDERQIASHYESKLAVFARAVEEETDEVPERGSHIYKKIIANASIVLVLFVLGFFIYSYFNFKAADVALVGFLPMNSQDKPVADVKNSAASAEPSRGVTVDVESGAEKKPHQMEGLPNSAVSAPATVKSEETKAAVIKAPIVKPVVLIIIAREKTWLRIKEEQKEAFQLLMQPGERIERSALQYSIDIGNAGGVSVQYQGNIMKPLGKSGEVVHLRLP